MPERVEDVAIRIDGTRWRAWESVELQRGLDSFSVLSFDAPFEPERTEFRRTFQPLSFKPLEVLVGGELLFSGTMLGVDPELEPDRRTVKVSGYAKPGVLEDCPMPASAWPLELNGLKLRAIAERLAAPFGLTVEMNGDEGAEFRRVALRPDEHVHAFLTELAKQRGLSMRDTPAGALQFHRPAASSPVVRLQEGAGGLTGVRVSFQPQDYSSEITGQARTRSGRGGARTTQANPFLSSVVRPSTFTLEETDGPDVPAATSARMGRMFANAMRVSVELPTWRTPDGALFEPGSTLSLEAPSAMVYRETTFLIREVTFRQEADQLGAQLALALPGAFSGEVPSALPWEAA